MTAADLLRSADGIRWTNEDGDADTMRLLPPLSPGELRELERRLPCPLPPDARGMFAVGRGLDGGPLESLALNGVDGNGEPLDFELFPFALPIAHDGFGNHWVVALSARSTRWGPVWYLCHDPPVAAWQCADVAEFLDGVLRLAGPSPAGPLEEMHERWASRVWGENPGVQARDAALASAAASGDAVLRDFAASLEPEWLVVDLRTARPGDGISWGRWGPRTPLRRAGDEPIFAYAPRSWRQRVSTWLTGR